MRDKGKRRLLELGKDLLIALLILSTAYLTLRGQAVVGLAGSESGWFGAVVRLLGRGGGGELPSGMLPEEPVEVRPLRMAVNIAGVGSYGVQYDILATDKLSEKMFGMLGEVLSSAGEPITVTEAAWRRALAVQSSVYFDFQGKVPLSMLYAWTEAGMSRALTEESVRRLLLAEDEEGALTLYYSNEDTGMYYACRVAEGLKGHLRTAVESYATNVNGSTFAFVHRGEEGYDKLAPYVMLPKSKAAAARTVYRASNPIGRGQNDQVRTDMIEALGFHPNANSSYVAGGKQVVKEGTADTLTAYDSGTVVYHSAASEEPKYLVGDGMSAPTLLDMVKATQPLAQRSAGALCGDGRTAGLYLMGITALEGGRWQVDYGYQLGGITVRLGQEGYAARFIVSGGRVSDFTLRLRSYTAVEEQSTVLPELQAAAAMGALGVGGSELLLVYEDNGSAEAVRAGWVAEKR